MNLTVSVIIPAYNIDKYIGDCIESVMDQTYSNLEIIVIDDGSTDATGRICDEYADTDDRIHVIHQSNRGLSVARNVGIMHARGEWITFVDGDDYIHHDMVRALYDTALNYSVLFVRCDFRNVSSNGCDHDWQLRKNKRYQVEEKSAATEMRDILEKRSTSNVWGTIYHKSLLNHLSFPKGYCYEDISFTPELLGRVSQLSVVKQELYYYRRQAGSITHALKAEKTRDLFEMLLSRVSSVDRYFPDLNHLACERLCAIVVNQYNDIIGTDNDVYRKWILKHKNKYLNVVPLSIIADNSIPLHRRTIVFGCKIVFRLTCWLKRTGIRIHDMLFFGDR